MKKALSITVKMSIALGIIQILEYSVPNVHVNLMVRLAKVAVMFLIIGYNLPK